jgi:hypothetical protein
MTSMTCALPRVQVSSLPWRERAPLSEPRLFQERSRLPFFDGWVFSMRFPDAHVRASQDFSQVRVAAAVVSRRPHLQDSGFRAKLSAPVGSCRIPPCPCHEEGRGFESLHPLQRTRW